MIAGVAGIKSTKLVMWREKEKIKGIKLGVTVVVKGMQR